MLRYWGCELEGVGGQFVVRFTNLGETKARGEPATKGH